MDDTQGPRSTISTPLTRLLDIRHPLLLAPMGDVAGGALAAAVSDAGGFGLIGGGYGEVPWLERELELAGDARVGVGFITFALADDDTALQIAIDAGVPAIQLSFGDPRPYADRIHAAGALLICQLQVDHEVDWAIEAGADVVVAQGRDAGGHGRPGRGTVGLVPSVVDRVEVPVVAAGGIADGRGVAAALMLGADGVALGTRLYATPEAISDQAAEAILVASRSEQTLRTSAVDVIRGPAWPEGHDGRIVRSDLSDRFATLTPSGDAERDQLAADYRAAAVDDYSMKPLWAGEGLDLVTAIEPAGDVVRRIASEAATALAGAGGLLRSG